MPLKTIHFALLAAALVVGAGYAAHATPVTYPLPPETATLKPGPDMETAAENCLVCHSADYITTQPPGKGKDFWTTEVNKMIKVYGASISSDDAAKIAAYLAQTY